MLHGTKNTLILPKYSSIKEHEGKGNWALWKYYVPPFSFFYQKKLKMILDLMDSNHTYHNILDFGSGPGIFTPSLKKKAIFVVSKDKNDHISEKWYFSAIVCASVLEFCELSHTIKLLRSITKPQGRLFVASPMKSRWSSLYFDAIGDKNLRNSDSDIVEAISKHYVIEEYKEWRGLYFALRARPK